MPDDDKLLDEAMQYEASQIGGTKHKKRPAASSKRAAEPAASDKQKVKKTVKKKPACQEEVRVDEEKQPNMTFEATAWGICRLECYKGKSYIRYKDAEKKWRSIIGSCEAGFHQRICKKLVEHVKSGKSKEDLYEIRAQIWDQIQKDVPDID